MPTIFRREGVWYINYSLAGRQYRRSLKTTDKRAAERALKKVSAELVVGTFRPEGHLTVSEFVEAFLRHQGERISAKELANYRYRLGRLCAFLGPKRKLTAIRPGHLSDFLDERKNPNDFNHWRGALHRFFEYALVKEAVPANPVKKVPRRKVPKPIPTWLTVEERETVLAAAEGGSLLVPLALGFFAGLRRGEIVALLWGSVDYGRREIVVRTPKDGEERIVPLSGRLEAILKAARRTAVKRVCLRGRKAWDADNLSAYVARHGRRCGVPRLNGPQILRRTFAAHLFEAGQDVARVSYWLGHSSVAVTERWYAQLAPGKRGRIDDL